MPYLFSKKAARFNSVLKAINHYLNESIAVSAFIYFPCTDILRLAIRWHIFFNRVIDFTSTWWLKAPKWGIMLIFRTVKKVTWKLIRFINYCFQSSDSFKPLSESSILVIFSTRQDSLAKSFVKYRESSINSCAAWVEEKTLWILLEKAFLYTLGW